MGSRTRDLKGGRGSRDNRDGQSRKPPEVWKGHLHTSESHTARGRGDKSRKIALRKPRSNY